MFLNRDGEFTKMAPLDPSYVQVLGNEPTVATEFHVRVMRRDCVGDICIDISAGTEVFHNYPTNEQILWCLIKHKGRFARVEKLYVFNDLPF